MGKCIVITSHIEGKIKNLINIDEDDYIICADGGYDVAAYENIVPSVVIGDLDSIKNELPKDIPVMKVPVKKDVTDTALSIDYGISKDFKQIFILGGMGGRVDHTIANIQNLFFYRKKGVSIIMLDKNNIVTTLIDGNTLLPYQEGYKLSLFSFSEKCTGVTVSGVLYPLKDYTLENTFPIGVSNEFIEGQDAYINVSCGQLLVILSKD